MEKKWVEAFLVSLFSLCVLLEAVREDETEFSNFRALYFMKNFALAGLPSQKPKEQQRSVLRPAVLQAPQPKAFSQMGK